MYLIVGNLFVSLTGALLIKCPLGPRWDHPGAFHRTTSNLLGIVFNKEDIEVDTGTSRLIKQIKNGQFLLLFA
ncbi:MAG TPA: hypothetical protein DIS88_11795 [Prevotella sp.]|nr:hypothetical protein [Prevotella sp.]